MKRIIIVLLSFIHINLCIGQDGNIKKNNYSDSLIVAERVARIKSYRLDDSLKRELLYYKIKEDYYTEALATQTSLFITVFTTIVGVVSLLGVSWFRKKIEQYNILLTEKIDANNNSFLAFKDATQHNSCVTMLQIADIYSVQATESFHADSYNKGLKQLVWASSLYASIYSINQEAFKTLSIQAKLVKSLDDIRSYIQVSTAVMNSKQTFPTGLDMMYFFQLKQTVEGFDFEKAMTMTNDKTVNRLFYSVDVELKKYFAFFQSKLPAA